MAITPSIVERDLQIAYDVLVNGKTRNQMVKKYGLTHETIRGILYHTIRKCVQHYRYCKLIDERKSSGGLLPVRTMTEKQLNEFQIKLNELRLSLTGLGIK